ncbi:MAG TPA: hypothetical protein VFS20_10360 [Longimicrobium sp.]|nr:hypothetical protein [Longimicrobium sp.]
MWMIDPARGPVRQKAGAAWFALLGVAGAWLFAAAPAQELREGWVVSLGWLFTLASCGVAAEAMWNGRAYRQNAMQAVLWGSLLIWVLVIYLEVPSALPDAWVPVLIAITVSSFGVVTTPSKQP